MSAATFSGRVDSSTLTPSQVQEIISQAKAEKGETLFSQMRDSIKKIMTVVLTAVFSVVSTIIGVPLAGLASLAIGPVAWVSIPVLWVGSWALARFGIVERLDAKDPAVFDFVAAQALLGKSITVETAAA